MKKTKKGLTLIEVIVALAIFSMVSFAICSSIIGLKKVAMRQEEYARLEMACYDMSAYYQKYNEEWYVNYFKCSVNDNIGYLTEDFTPTSDKESGRYKIIFNEAQILSILDIEGETIFVEYINLPINDQGADNGQE